MGCYVVAFNPVSQNKNLQFTFSARLTLQVTRAVSQVEGDKRYIVILTSGFIAFRHQIIVIKRRRQLAYGVL